MDAYRSSMYHIDPVVVTKSKESTYKLVALGGVVCVCFVIALVYLVKPENKTGQGAPAAAPAAPAAPAPVKDSAASAFTDTSGDTSAATGSDKGTDAAFSGPQNAFLTAAPEESMPGNDLSAVYSTAYKAAAPKPDVPDTSVAAPQYADDASASAVDLSAAYGAKYAGSTSASPTPGTAATAPLMASTPEALQTVSSIAPATTSLVAPAPQGQKVPSQSAIDQCKQTYCGKVKNDIMKKKCEARCAVNPRFISGIEVTSYRNDVDYLRPSLNARKYVDPDAGDYGKY